MCGSHSHECRYSGDSSVSSKSFTSCYISVSPSSVNFGNVNLGSTSEKTVTIQNKGYSDLVINSINIAGANASDFSQTNNCTTIPKGNSCTVTATFAPASVGKKSGMISISSNDPKKPTVNVKLSGNAKSSTCTYSISPPSQQFDASGGSGSVNVTAPTGCPWTAISNNTDWITITSGGSGSGNGSVTYAVAANTGTSQRTGTMTIAGQTFTVTQGPACIYSISPTNQSFDSTGGSATVNVTSPIPVGDCKWIATSNNQDWITITSGSSGSGNGTVTYAVAAYTGTSQRTGTITIAGKTFTVNQEPGSSQISITSVSSTSPTPLTPLALATAGIATNDPVSVTFFNSAGFSVSNTPIRVETDGTVVVAVPLYVDPSTSTVTNGTVSLVLSQGSQASAPVTLDIQNLPTLDTYGMQLGEVSHAFLVFRALLLGRRIGQLQAASLLFGTDTSELQSTLSTNLTAVLFARSDIDRVMLDNSTVITNGTLPNGTVIQWDQISQDMMDRVIAVYLLQQFGNVTSSLTKVTARSLLSSASREALTPATVADLKEIIAVIKDSRTLPNFVRDIQTSESGLDYALAVLKAGSDYIPNSVEFLGENQLADKLGDCSGTGPCTVTMDTYKGVGAIFTHERWSGTYSGKTHSSCSYYPDTYDYNVPFSFTIDEHGFLYTYGGDVEPIGTSGQVTFFQSSTLDLFTGTINEDAGTASGTWTEHIPGNYPGDCTFDGNGTWSANRMLS